LFGGWFSAISGFKTLVGAVGLILGACILLPCFLPLVIQSIRSIIEAAIERKQGKCSLTLDASRIIQGTQQTDFPPDATTTFTQELALSAKEAWDKPSASAPGDLTNFQIPAEPPLTMPLLSTKQLDRSAPIIPTKGWNVRFLAFLGQAEGPETTP
jgi:hypothetical protein